MDELPAAYQIHDNRSPKSMTKISFSGHTRKDVMYEFYHTVMNALIPRALRWAAEMHVSGYEKQLWDTLIDIYWRNINIQNPKLMFYLYEMQQQIHELGRDRNHPLIRHRIADVVILVGLSNKNDLFFRRIYPKVSENDFTYESMRNMIQSDNTQYSDPYVVPGDTSDITLAMNEISYCLQHRDQDRFRYCIYWYTWMTRRAQLHRKETGKDMATGYRDIGDIDAKYKRDWIWSIWLITIDRVKQSRDSILDNVMKVNYHFYKQGFTSANKEKKKIYLHLVWYYYFHLNSIDMQRPLGLEQVQRIQGIAQIHDVYKSLMERRPAHLAVEIAEHRRVQTRNRQVATTLQTNRRIGPLSSFISTRPDPISRSGQQPELDDDPVDEDPVEEVEPRRTRRGNAKVSASIDPQLEQRLNFMESYVPKNVVTAPVTSPLDILIRQQTTQPAPMKTISTKQSLILSNESI